jgi:hypothetical protein
MVDRKEVIRQYKQTLTPMGVYQIRNQANGRIFIGSSKNLPGKLNSCRFQLIHGSFINRELQNEFNEYGESSFSFDVLDQLQPKDEPDHDYTEDLKLLEEMWFDELQPWDDKGYHKRRTPRG